jgi:HK97 family phage major capsid protein
MGMTTSTLPVPANSAELAEMIADDQRIKPVLADRETLRDWIQAYADKHQAPGTDIARQVEAEAQRVLTTWLKERGATDDVKRLNRAPQQQRPANMLTSHKQASAYNAKALGAKIDGEFADAAEFFAAAWHLNPDEKVRAKMQKIRNTFSSVVPADGGFLVPERLRAQLMQIALETAVMRPRATVVPMDSARVPFPCIDVTTNATSVFGGMIGYWTEESGTLQDTSARFSRVVLDTKKLTGYSVVPNELITDSIISFAALIESLWPRAISWYEDVAFMVGTGVGEPLGILDGGNTALVAQAAEAAQPPDTVVLENIVRMYARMLPASLNQAVWLVAPNVLPQLFTMALNVGTGGSAVMLTNAAGPAPMTILGRPVIVTEKARTVGDQGDISFVDLSYYLIGDRQAMSAASSTDFRFSTDQTAFRIIQRVDGRPWIQSAITPQNGSTDTLSPFVALAAR